MNGENAPAVFVFDERGSCVTRTAGDHFSWEQVKTDALQLLEDVRLSGRAAAKPRNDYVLYVTALHGSSYAAILVRNTRADDPIARLADRYGLTRRECAVLRALASGCSTVQIAEELSIAPATVVIHVKRILAKTDTSTRAAILGRVLDEAVALQQA
jgi:DNA-binding CsgD family transcriptional regulator